MVKMLAPEKQDKPLICRIMPLIADVCMIFLRCLVRSVQEEWEATPLPSPQNLLFSQCLCPIVESIFAVKENSVVDNDDKAQSSPFFSLVLPWAVTASFLLVKKDSTFRSKILPAALLAANVSRQPAKEEPVEKMAPQTRLHDTAVLESSHPYEASERDIYHVTLPEAAFLAIEFDISCDLAPDDYVQVFGDDVCKQAVFLIREVECVVA